MIGTLPGRLKAYLEAPNAWNSIKQAILDHDPTCASLADIWLARTGGVTCPSDVATCDDCQVTFYNEGLMGQYVPDWNIGDPILQTVDPEDGEEYEAVLCDCCGRKRREADTEVVNPKFAVEELPEFLGHRLAEEAEEVSGWPDSVARSVRLAELEGRRLIVMRHARVRFGVTRCHCCWVNEYDTPMFPCFTLKAVAIPYSQHGDFRWEWNILDEERP